MSPDIQSVSGKRHALNLKYKTNSGDTLDVHIPRWWLNGDNAPRDRGKRGRIRKVKQCR